MIMVLLASFSTALSFYLVYRNKNTIGYQILKYYTFLDEYFASKLFTEESKLIYYSDMNVIEGLNTGNLVTQLNENNRFFIVHDFIVKENEEVNKPNTKRNLYTIFLVNYNDSDRSEDNILYKNTLWKFVDNIYSDIRYIESKETIENSIFNNKMDNYESNMDWKCPIIGASVTISDKEQIINYKDYDITNFICGICRKNKPLILDNTNIQKHLWILIFNYLFKSKNIYIQSEQKDNLEFSWTIITESCMIYQGIKLKIDF